MNLLNAISDLRAGDVEAVFDCVDYSYALSGADPFICPNITTRLANGPRLAAIHLKAVLTVGECELPSHQKDRGRRRRKEIGGRRWGSAEPDNCDLANLIIT